MLQVLVLGCEVAAMATVDAGELVLMAGSLNLPSGVCEGISLALLLIELKH